MAANKTRMYFYIGAFVAVVIFGVVVTAFVLSSRSNCCCGKITVEGEITGVESVTPVEAGTQWQFKMRADDGKVWTVNLVVSNPAVVMNPGLVIRVTGTLRESTTDVLDVPKDAYGFVGTCQVCG